MRILIIGTNTINKGAELMLYAIIQEIERKVPNAEILFPYTGLPEGKDYIQTSVKFKQLPGLKLYKFFKIIKGEGFCRKLKLSYPYFTELYPVKGIDVILDAGGFQFSDQFWIDIELQKRWLKFLKVENKYGTKIIFLPQAFGPFNNKLWHPIIKTLGNTVNILFSRDYKSSNYLLSLGFPEDKLFEYPDFTSLVNGTIPEEYKCFKNFVAIIPNIQMINSGKTKLNAYISYLKEVILQIHSCNKKAFLLNHEGERDFCLCKQINEQLNDLKLPIITNLNALETKGVISQSYLVISSRFHGVASALSTGVPCLATSWSHKYELLYKEYNISDCIIDINDPKSINKIIYCLDKRNNKLMRDNLKLHKKIIDEKTNKMWEHVWKEINK